MNLMCEISDKNTIVQVYIGYIRTLINDLNEYFSENPDTVEGRAIINCYFQTNQNKAGMLLEFADKAEKASLELDELLD